MAKSPRKGATGLKTAAYSQKLNPKVYNTPKYGGKNFKAYNYQPQRRWSIVESSSDSSDNDASRAQAARSSSSSESESSLTAMSENDESQVRRKGSVFFEGSKHSKPRKTVKGMKSARKRVPKKMPFKNQATAESSSDDDDDDDDDDDSQHIEDYLNMEVDAEDSDEGGVGLGGIYSMINNTTNNSVIYTSSESESDTNSKSDSAEEDDNMSSSDDSEVDFVQLQAERRAKSMKSLRAIKGLQKPKPQPAEAANHKKGRRGSLYRRKSEVALPEDINFKFEFDDANSTSILEEDGEDDNSDDVNTNTVDEAKNEEEDIGELVGDDQSAPNLDFHFDEPLMHVPKFKDDEFNSDEDYEFDDNDLLATLQADNDIDEFITGGAEDLPTPRTRQGSLSSMNDDTEDPFLREEEKYLVNEFETNGFDDEEDPARIETARVMNSFKTNNAQREQVVQYASSSDDSQFGSDLELSDDDNEYGDDEGDVDDYMDFIDFAEPIVDKRSGDDNRQSEKSTEAAKSKPHFSKKHKRKGPLDSEEEDDSYLWNYFFSSDADSPDDLQNESFAVEEQLMLEEIFRQNVDDKKNAENDKVPENVEQDQEYDSGESTDVDLSLPPASSHNQGGSKMAKEVLSSKTADYRPPVLGTWIAIESKPFGIIDGLSTRTITTQATNKNPRGKGWKNVALKNDSEDLAIELNELLNISELDNDDENDVRIWRDFNNNKKHVPLGAFRNKLHMNPPMTTLEPMAGFNPKMGGNFAGNPKLDASLAKVRKQSRPKPQANPTAAASLSKKLNLSSKHRRQRASIADAVSEGFRPTKSGLFSENVLADVEDVLGDDREFMALIKGL